MKIWCSTCGKEVDAWKVSATNRRGRREYFNRCPHCRTDYGALPPGEAERKRQRELEKAGQRRLID